MSHLLHRSTAQIGFLWDFFLSSSGNKGRKNHTSKGRRVLNKKIEMVSVKFFLYSIIRLQNKNIFGELQHFTDRKSKKI